LRKLEFSRDGSLLAGSTFNGEFMVWEFTPSGPSLKWALQPRHVQMFAFAADNRSIAIAQFHADLKCLGLWDLQTGKRVLQFSDNPDGVNALALSPDGRTLASADVDQSIRFWDVMTGRLQSRIHEGVGWVKTLVFSPDGRRIAFAGRDCAIQMRDLEAALASAADGSNRS